MSATRTNIIKPWLVEGSRVKLSPFYRGRQHGLEGTIKRIRKDAMVGVVWDGKTTVTLLHSEDVDLAVIGDEQASRAGQHRAELESLGRVIGGLLEEQAQVLKGLEGCKNAIEKMLGGVL